VKTRAMTHKLIWLVIREVVNGVSPRVGDEHMEPITKTPIELKLHRMVGRTRVVVQNGGVGTSRGLPGLYPPDECAPESADIASRKCLLTNGLLDGRVPLPGVRKLIAFHCGDCAPRIDRIRNLAG